MKYVNPTRQTPPTEAEIAARLEFFEQSMRDADRVNAELMLAGAQQREAEFQAKLVADTGLELHQLVAIKAWLEAQ